MEIPSRLFYGGALEECADKAHTEFLNGWDKLKMKDERAFPLLMIGETNTHNNVCVCFDVSLLTLSGVDGQHEHEVESPSFYNQAEVRY